MTEPSPVDDIRADLDAIRTAIDGQSLDFAFGSLCDLQEALRALSRIATSRPSREPLAPYSDFATYDRDLRRIRDRLEAALAYGSIPAADVLDATSALIDLGRGIALHLRAMRREVARRSAA